MAEARHLKNAPITEALLDFRVRPKQDSEFPVQRLEQVGRDIGDAYPVVEAKELRKLEMEVGPKSTSTRTREHGVQAFWFKTEEASRVAQFRADGFTYNVLKPYENWESMEAEALRLWRIYEEVLAPRSIIRIGTRFINHVVLERPVDWNQHLTYVPSGVYNLPGQVLNFHDRAMLQDENETVANVVVASDDTQATSITVLADIDVFRAEEVPVPVDVDEISRTLSRLRAFKNDIFFSIFTERTIKSYE